MRSKPLTDAARGETCTLQIPGACNHDQATTVFAHFPDESHGMSRKSDDFIGGFACSGCHDALDGRSNYPFDFGERDWYMRRAQNRTLRRWVALGVITIKGAKP